MTPKKAYNLGVRADDCKVIGRYNDWVVICGGCVILSGNVFTCSQFVGQLSQIGS